MTSSASTPRMLRIRQTLESPTVQNVALEVDRQLAALDLGKIVKPGQTVAITVGSRGIANIAMMTKAIVSHIKDAGGVPVIIPAMGSHGGGTADGQVAILAGYDITEESMGVEIQASMETVVVAETPQGIPVHFDKHAYAADHVLIFNRVKPHTGFVGDIESGLHKMMLIGLGKHNGAKIYHRAIVEHSFGEIIKSVADVVLERCSVIGGLGVVENSKDETGLIRAVEPANFYAVEKELLALSRQWLPGLPFDEADLLIVDQMGKNISGTGMDTNVVGRKYNDNVAMEHDQAKVRRIFVRSLSPETHGNASGIGIADFTTAECVAGIDRKITNINSITASHPNAAAIPLTMDTDRECVEAALQTIGLVEPADAKVIHIQDTLHLEEVLVSEAFRAEVDSRDDLTVIGESCDMQFDAGGRLSSVAD